MVKATNIRVVYVSSDSYNNAMKIARNIVSEKLCACCSVIPNVISVFGWQGSINERNEFILMIKTSAAKIEALEARILELHCDEVPEIISLPLDVSSEPYLSWLEMALND